MSLESELTERQMYKKQWDVENWHRVFVNSYKKKDPAFDLVPDDLLEMWESQDGRCYWTSIPLELSPTPRHLFQPSLERIDNSLSHTKDNCVLVCWGVNYARGSADLKTWLRFLKSLSSIDISKIEDHEVELSNIGHKDQGWTGLCAL